jgi:hypothetical protein
MMMYSKVKMLRMATFALTVSLLCGCGDETTRLAGTIDLPKKDHAQPVTKKIVQSKHGKTTTKP